MSQKSNTDKLNIHVCKLIGRICSKQCAQVSIVIKIGRSDSLLD